MNIKVYKEDKMLYTFLSIASKMIGSSVGIPIIFGTQNKLYVKSENHVMKYKYTAAKENKIDFGNTSYQIKMLPGGTYELEAYISQSDYEKKKQIEVINLLQQISSTEQSGVINIDKDDTNKLAIINKLVCQDVRDVELKYIKKLGSVLLYEQNDNVVLSNELNEDSSEGIMMIIMDYCQYLDEYLRSNGATNK